MEASPRIFISYSHDSPEHEQAVLGLAARLRADDVDAQIDQYVMAPSQGWPRWMENEIEKADFVLLVCTKIYLDRVRMHAGPGKGLGALWEANLIYQHIYEAGTVNSKFIPVLPSPGSVEHIPMPLRGAQRYSPFSDDGYNALYRRLTNQPAVPVPPLGRRRTLPPDGHSTATSAGASSLRCVISSRAAILLPDEHSFFCIPVVQSQWDESEARLVLEPDDDEHESRAFLDSLRGQCQNVFIGYKNNAADARVDHVQQETSNGHDRWHITFRIQKADFSTWMEMNMAGLTADEAAVLRAKRLLLNESAVLQRRSNMDDHFKESMIEGQGSPIAIKQSPFPILLNGSAVRSQADLEASWILAVLQLKLSATVEHVSRLELTLRGDTLDIIFSGRRKKIYSNQPAFTIEFSGTCLL